MARDVPDDWDRFWNTCPRDSYRWHASEGYCPVCELAEDADQDQDYEDDYDPDLYPYYIDDDYDF